MKKWLMLGIVVFFVACYFIAFNYIDAAELTDTYDLITDVEITDVDGNELTSDVSMDEDIILKYYFSIPDSGDVFEGDEFVLDIPDEIYIQDGGDFDISDDDGNVVAYGVLETDGTVTITFTDYVDTHSDIEGSFWLYLSFNEDELGLGGSTDITFDIGGTSDPVVITVDFEDLELEEVSVTKKGSYNSTTNEITWTITVDSEDTTAVNAVIEDTISSDQNFVDGSLTINSSEASSDDYDLTDGVLTYTFPEVITSEQVITYKTTLDSSVLTPDMSSYDVTNSCTLTSEVGTADSNTATVTIPVDIIDKTGEYDSDTHTITWTIEVDNSNFDLSDVNISDYIPDGLTIDESSILVDESNSGYTYDSDNDLLEVDLGDISESHTITFDTVVDDSYYLDNEEYTFSNTATILADELSEAVSDKANVDVTSTIITKKGSSYDASTGQITWTIVVNSNESDIEDALITDNIPVGQEYVSDSATISDGADSSGFTYTEADDSDTEYTGTLTYDFDSDISETYTIQYKTQVTDTDLYKSNSTKTYSNTASISGSNIDGTSDTGTIKAKSNILTTTGIDYDYTTRYITWQVTVDADEIDLDNISIEDIITDGQTYVEGSATVTSGTTNATFSYTDSDDETNGVLNCTVTGTQSEEFVFTFQTEVTDLTIFETNGTKTLSNTATLTHDELTEAISSTGTQTIENTVVEKTADYTSGNNYIDWTVSINTNGISLTDGILTDIIEDGLTLDTSSIVLYHQSIDEDGNMVLGDEIELTAENVVFDLDTGLFTFTIPDTLEGSYLLTYRTYVSDKDQSPFSNSISFSGTGTLQTSTSSGINVSWTDYGSEVVSETGTITITKTDSDDDTILLEGAVFRLYDKYGNAIDEVTTSEDGTATFSNLRFDTEYTVKEVEAPTGYLLSDDEYTFTIESSATDTSIEYSCEDDIIQGNITFQKLDENSEGLEGAVFTMYNESDEAVATATSDEDGTVLFEDVDYGSYTILETTAPTGYTLNTDTLTATITTDGETVSASSETISDDPIYGNIEFTKVDSDTSEAISGAVFAIYDADDTDFSDPLYEATSEDDGLVYFENVIYGNYVIKEISASTGYVISDEDILVSVLEDGYTYELDDVTNEIITSDIEITKTDVTGNLLEGAVIGLYDTEGNLLAQATTDENGSAVFEDVEYGEYIVKEISAPEKYDVNDTEFSATVETDGETIEISIVDERSSDYPWGTLSVQKLDEDGVTPLSGAYIALYDSDDTDFTNPLYIVETDSLGIAYFEELPAGTYLLKELTAPEGYGLSDEVQTITIENTSETVYADDILDSLITDDITIVSVDDDGNALAGIVYYLYDEDGNLISTAVSDEDGLVVFESVAYGNYVVKYYDENNSLEELSFSVDEVGEDIEATVVEDVTDDSDSVDTGDYSKIYIYCGMILGSIFVINITRFKREK